MCLVPHTMTVAGCAGAVLPGILRQKKNELQEDLMANLVPVAAREELAFRAFLTELGIDRSQFEPEFT